MNYEFTSRIERAIFFLWPRLDLKLFDAPDLHTFFLAGVGPSFFSLGLNRYHISIFVSLEFQTNKNKEKRKKIANKSKLTAAFFTSRSRSEPRLAMFDFFYIFGFD